MASKLYDFTPTELQKLLDESNSYSDLLRKINMNPKGSNPNTLKKIIAEYKLDETKLNENRHNLFSRCNEHTKRVNVKYPLEDILAGKHPGYQSSRLLERLVEEGYKIMKCEHCGIIDWMGQSISFHLHHKDGNHDNNALDNLEVLCPNCHSQTNNFAGKNSNKRKIGKILCPICNKNYILKSSSKCRQCYGKTPKVSKEEFFEIMKSNTYDSAAELLGVDSNTVAQWHKYYAKIERQNGNFVIGSDKAPSREILKEKIRTMTFVAVGKEYEVRSNTIKKWCDKYCLPRHTKVIQSMTDEEWEKI